MGQFKISTQADVAKALNTLQDQGVRNLTLRLVPDVAAAGQISAAATPANTEIVTIVDGAGTSVIFEFTDGGGLTVGDVEVDKSATTNAGMGELLTAVNGSALVITAGTVTGAGPYVLPLVHDTQGVIGNATTLTTDAAALTLTQLTGGLNGNLNAAAVTQAIPFAQVIPAGSLILAAAVEVVTDVSGGSASAAVVDVGDGTDADKYVAAEDVFGSGGGFFQGSPGAGFTGLSGPSIEPAAITPEVLITVTGDDVEALDAGEIVVTLVVASPPAA